jgi:O-antigen ligase
MIRKFIDQVPIFLIYIIVAFLPLVFSFIFPINNVFELTKSAFFYFSLSLLFSLTIIKIFYFGFPTVDTKGSAYRKELIYIIVLFIIFIFYVIFNSFFIADNSNISIFGSYRRQQGLIFYFSSFLFFLLILYNFLMSQKKYLRFLYLSISLAGFLVAILGIFQYLGIDYYVWQESLLAGRVISSLGQANNLGAFLLFSLSASLLVLRRKKLKYIMIVLIYFQLLALYLSGSKSSYLALIVSLLIYLFLKIRKKLSLKKILIYFFSLTLILVFLSNNRVNETFKSGSSSLRLDFYQTSLNTWLKKPVLGYGLEHSGQALISGYSPNWALFLQVNDYPDRVHNILLQTILNYGVAGFVILIFLFLFLFKYFFAFRKNFSDEQLIIFLGLFAYFIFLLFNFSSITSHLYFYLFLALSFYYSLVAKISIKKIKIKKITLYLISLCLLIIVSFCYNYSSRKISADRLFFQCKQTNNLDLCFQAIDKARSKAAKEHYKAYTYSSLIDQYLSYTEELKVIAFSSIDKYYNDLQDNNDVYLRFKLACFLDKQEANSLFNKARQMSPSRPLIYQTKADCHLRKSEFQLAIDYYLQTLDLLPNNDYKLASERFAAYLKFYRHWLHYSLAQAYFAQANYDLAIENYRLSFYLYPYSQAVWERLVETLYLNEQVDLAAREVLWAQKYWPDEGRWLEFNYK